MKNLLSDIETEEHFNEGLERNFGVASENLAGFYPKLKESLMPFAATGVSSETFAYWKEQGIIDYEISEESGNRQIRLNIFQYVWLKTCIAMRDLNIPPEAIIEAKEYLFSELVGTLIEEKKGLLDFLKENSGYDEDKRNSYRDMLKILESNYSNCSGQDAIYFTVIGGIIGAVLLRNENVSLILSREENEYHFFPFSSKALTDFGKVAFEILNGPNIQIPLREHITDFFELSTSSEPFELISDDENRVLEVIRKPGFKEMAIRLDEKKKDLILESIQDGDILEQKAKEIRKLLELDPFSEITLKYRNDKHIYFKNKKRIK